MYFGSKRFKQELVAEICSILGYSCVKQGDPFTSYIANEKIELNTKKSKRNFAVTKMAETIFNYKCVGKLCNYNSITNDLFKYNRKKSIIFLIGDFFDIKKFRFKTFEQKA